MIPYNKISPEIEQRVITLYQEPKMNAAKTAKVFGITDVSVLNILKRNGVQARSKSEAGKGKGENLERSAEIVKALGTGETRISIARRLGTFPGLVTLVGKRYGIAPEPLRQYAVNEEAFSSLSPESCYWMGWMAADGSLIQQGVSLYISLATAEPWPATELRKFLSSTHPISIRENRGFKNSKPLHTIRISSRKLAESLMVRGITRNKSLTLKVSEELAASIDFWRGMLDGDGCIYPATPSLHLVGSHDSLEQWVNFISSRIGKRPAISKVVGDKVFQTTVGGAECLVQLLEILGYYDYSKPALPRKRAKAEEIRKLVSEGQLSRAQKIQEQN